MGDVLVDMAINTYLQHFGIKGMKWGVRKRRDSPTMQKIREKYTDEEIATALTRMRVKQEKEKILESPTKLYRNRHMFTKAELDSAMSRMKMERELRSLSRDEIKSGADYAAAILSYATTAATVYTLYQKFSKKAAS